MAIDQIAFPQTIQTGKVWTACPQPAVATIASKDSVVYSLGLSNPTGAGIDFTISDVTGPTVVMVITVASKAVQILSPQGGMLFSGGIKIGASAAGAFYFVTGGSTIS